MSNNPEVTLPREASVSRTALEQSSDATQSGQEPRVDQSASEVLVSPTVLAYSQDGIHSPGDTLIDQSTNDNESVSVPDIAVDPAAHGSNEQGDSSAASDDDLGVETLEEEFDMEYVYENGRRYANDTCLYPNDDAEETRLNIGHQVRRLVLDGDYTTAWISGSVKRILDVGTGPGDWAIAMGEAYPNAQVIATDITLYSPVAAPSNVDFRIEDATQDWDYEEPFDYIHMRDMVVAVPDFLHIYQQVTKSLKRNGTFELVTGGPMRLRNNYATSALKEWTELLRVAREASGDKAGLDYTARAIIEEAGLREMKRVHKEVSLGEWMPDTSKRRVGRMALVACLEGVEAASLRALTKYLEWPVDQARELIERVKSELLDPRNEPYCELDWIVAKRLMI